MTDRGQIDRLLDQVAQGDTAAAAQLVDRIGGALYGRCIARLGQEAADDAFCDILSTILEQAADRAPISGSRWIEIVTRNALVNRSRRAGVAERGFMRLPHVPPVPLHAEALDPAGASQALARFDGPRREALALIWARGASYDQIARRFGQPQTTVRGWVMELIDLLYDAAGGHAESPEEEALAAEYALGLLSPAEAGQVEDLMHQSPETEAAVGGWFQILSALSIPATQIDPAPELRQRALAEATLPVDAFDAPRGLAGFLRPVIWTVGLGGLLLAVLSLLST